MSSNEKNLIKLVQFALEQTANGNQCFVEFSGHVGRVDFRMCGGKWYEGINYKVQDWCSLSLLDDQQLEDWTGLKIQALAPAS